MKRSIKPCAKKYIVIFRSLLELFPDQGEMSGDVLLSRVIIDLSPSLSHAEKCFEVNNYMPLQLFLLLPKRT